MFNDIQVEVVEEAVLAVVEAPVAVDGKKV